MKRYEEEAVTRKTLAEMRCDLCGAVTSKPRWPDGSEITVERFLSGGHPDAGSDSWSFDCCPGCWQGVIVPLFVAKGSQPRHIET